LIIGIKGEKSLKRKNTKQLIMLVAGLLLGIAMMNDMMRLNSQIASAANDYSVVYVIGNDWGSGASVNVTVKNNGPSVINGWALSWTFPGNQKITNIWNGTYTQTGASVTVSNLSYNAVIPANGGAVSFGFNLSYTGTNAKPTSFTLNNSSIPSPTATPVLTPTPTPTSATSPPPSSVWNALLIGRFDNSDPTGPKFAWSATTIKANFKGTSIAVNLKSTGDNWFNVIIDNIVRTPVNIPSGATMPVVLASGLSSDAHTIELVRRTEAWVGDVQFLGFAVGQGKLLDSPTAASRRIEFIGDSITCGYGNEGSSQYQSFTTKNENAYLAYGSVAARALGADQITVAWSGKGVIRNYGGDTHEMMPELYSRILPYDTALTWNPSQWIPQVVVINLGTNDFSTGTPDKDAFIATYVNFVKRIRSQYSGAHIYCALGPMLNGDSLINARDFLNKVVNQFHAAGDSKVRFIEFPMQDGTLGYGEDWHPTVATHAQMAKRLIEQLKNDLGW
jgi:lysophospholipase L1-like esterase